MATSKVILAASFLFLLSAILTWPPVLSQFLSLDWRLRDVTPAAWFFHFVMLGGGILIFIFRRWLSRHYWRLLPSPRHVQLAVLTLLLSTAATLVVAELALRLLNRPFAEHSIPSENATAQFDPDLGWTYIPNLRTSQPFGSAKRVIPIDINDIGARVRNAGDKFDPSLPTALFVGCSATWGHGVRYEESFSGLLDDNPAFPFQVVNLGVQAYGTDQTLLRLKRFMPHFNVKVVIYTFLCDHVRRNAVLDRRILMAGHKFIGTKPKFDLRLDGSLYQSYEPELYENYEYSRLWSYLLVHRFLKGPHPSLDLTRSLIAEMDRYVTEHGAIFLVNWWNNDPRCGPDPFRGMDLNVLDLAENAPPDWTTWIIPGDNHADPRAQRYAAGRLLERLQELGVSQPHNQLSQ